MCSRPCWHRRVVRTECLKSPPGEQGGSRKQNLQRFWERIRPNCEAAITPGGLYHYFRSKEDVIKAVVQDSADQAVRDVTSIAQESPGPRSALQRLGALLAQTVQSPEFLDNARLDVEIWSESLRSEDL